MFALLKKKNPYEQAAQSVYALALENTRKAEFYETYNVPDSFDGRFDLLVLHVFLVFQRMLEDGIEAAEDFNQALFDATFADMDQTLREMGIGDMGVPKHMRKMMRGFNGRMHAYSEALEQGRFQDALRNNLYGTVEDIEQGVLSKIEGKALAMLKVLKEKPSEDIFSGRISFEKDA